jgi:hypothetical protein
MAYELGTYRKPGKPDRTARTPSEAVQLTWDGYQHVKAEDAPAPKVKERSADAKNAAPPELTEAEMAKLPEAKDAEVVDLTNEQPKPRSPRR